jgi:hypothetical protein
MTVRTNQPQGLIKGGKLRQAQVDRPLACEAIPACDCTERLLLAQRWEFVGGVLKLLRLSFIVFGCVMEAVDFCG